MMVINEQYPKSSFRYWFAHWCAVNMTAMNLGCWKLRFLFHDWYKPWMRLLGFSYFTIRNFHRKHAGHHNGSDLIGMIIDWEASRFTKLDAPMNARETLNNNCPHMKPYMEYLLDELGL